MTDTPLTEAQITEAINRIEQRLDLIEETLSRLGHGHHRPDASGIPPDVLEFVRAGRKIEAIKRYRELTGVGLAQAREVIERL